MNRQVFLLAGAQALIQTTAVLITTVGGLIGAKLAQAPAWATAPVGILFLGTALTLYPASIWMSHVGRRKGFISGGAVGLVGAIISAIGLYLTSLALVCLGTFLIGIYQGFAQFYRFAALELVEDTERSRALSWVMVGGVGAALMGPLMAQTGKDLLPVEYLGSFIIVVFIGLLAIGLLAGLSCHNPPANIADGAIARKFSHIIKDSNYLIALFGAASGFGLMTLTMTATPLAMTHSAHSLGVVASVIQMHVLAMYLPSFVTGRIIKHLGAVNVMLIGTLCFFVNTALSHGNPDMLHFATSLIFVGIGWNFLYIGGTTLLTESIHPSERGKAFGFNDTLIFMVTLGCAFSAGSLVLNLGWALLNTYLAPWVMSVALALLWLKLKKNNTITKSYS